MREYPKLLELYCFGCMGPVAVSPRADVLAIVERLHTCDDAAKSPAPPASNH